MSTRRARIKAVTSLPPRRKNIDGSDATKNKVQAKDDAATSIVSPKTQRESVITQSSEKIPPAATVSSSSIITPTATTEIPKNQSEDVLPGPSFVPPEKSNEKGLETPIKSEKVSVITSVSSINKPVFLSPKCVGSPLRKPTASPLVVTYTLDIQRLKSPEKKLENTEVFSISYGAKSSNYDNVHSNSISNVASNARSDVLDDYNVPSVPESIPEDTVMDGIVPLQSVSNAPKPISILKNEIISENAEVLFDPIVPLPSPSKVRPKLRPVPRLAPLRRNSVQGSASESEDESRRALLNSSGGTPAPHRQRHDSHTSHSTMLSLPHRDVNRVRNDSICSSISQSNATQPAVASSPLKEKHYTKTRRDTSRRVAAMRRRRENVKKDTLTMYDLIFYNPTTNPIVLDEDEINLKAANEKEQAVRNDVHETKENEEAADDPPDDAAPVPQIKLGPNGEIILDEQSLVIKQSDSKRQVSKNVVHEGGWVGGAGGGGRYRRTPRTAEWSDAETVRFYRAVAAMGTDFMLMEKLFPGRTRRDLKLKFKKEERVNAAQVDKALRTSSKWDPTHLLEEFSAEREVAEKRDREIRERQIQEAREEKQRYKALKELRIKQSRASKVLGSSIISGDHDESLTANGLISRIATEKAMERKRKATNSRKTLLLNGQPSNPTNGEFATLTPANQTLDQRDSPPQSLATIHKIDPPKSQNKIPEILNSQISNSEILNLQISNSQISNSQQPVVPSNIESGSLVVLTVNDPSSPSKKMLQTYIAHGEGRLTPVALPASFLNSVVSYMKKGTPKSTISAGSSPHLTSPSSVASVDSRASSTPGVIHVNGSPAKRQRHSSYTITQL